MEAGEVRAALFAALKVRRAEVEQEILARAREIADSAGVHDDEYVEALTRAVSAGVAYGLAGVEQGEEYAGPIPTALFSQARQSARSGITASVALRQYFAGYTLFNEFVVRAADDCGSVGGGVLAQVLRTQAALFERLTIAVMGEYTRERGQRRSPEKRRLEQVKGLLSGEPVDLDEVGYELGDWHIGAVASGNEAARALRQIAQVADRRLLAVRPDGETVWAWFGGRRRIEIEEIARRIASEEPGGTLVALGEPARGVEGWRLTHQQASAVLRIVRRGATGVVRYADVGLLAAIAQDQVLASSLHQLYLAPLAGGRDGGAGLRKTLRAYFSAGRNVSSAASALGVSRQTVANRLRIIEEKLGRTLESCAPEVEVALRLEVGGELVDPAAP